MVLFWGKKCVGEFGIIPAQNGYTKTNQQSTYYVVLPPVDAMFILPQIAVPTNRYTNPKHRIL
jgi:hypothetical protein